MIKTIEPYWLGIPVRAIDQASPNDAPRVMHWAERALQSPTLIPISFPLELFHFLSGCRFLPTVELLDNAVLPQEFERRQAGGTFAHALWAWRKCIDLEEGPRLTIGAYHDSPHAWVTLYEETRAFIFETTRKDELVLLRSWEQSLYEPWFSIDANLNYFEHMRL
jgi:hypothetical protein